MNHLSKIKPSAMRPGEDPQGLWVSHAFLDFGAGRLSLDANLWGGGGDDRHRALVTRDRDGMFHVWSETPMIQYSPLTGPSVPCVFHNLDHIAVHDDDSVLGGDY